MRAQTGRRLAILFVSLAASGIGPGGAAAAGEVRMQALLNPDGSGRLFANTGGEEWTWDACTPDLTTCRPFGAGRDVSTGAAPPNTVFRVSSGGATGLSPVWLGNVAPVASPSVSGAVRANELVTPVAGQWSGGWEGERSSLGLSACPDMTGQGCVTLTHSHFPGSCPAAAAVLDPAFTGDYLRVSEQRTGAGPHIMLAYAVGSPYGLDLQAAGQTVTLATIGRIGRASGPRTAQCGPEPLNSASISKRGAASVVCGLGCRAVLIARGEKGPALRRVRKLSRNAAPPPRLGERQIPLRGPVALQFPRRSLQRLGPGPVHLTVKIDGQRMAGRTVSSG